MERLDYIQEHAPRYMQWLGEVERSPYSPLDMAEFAVISAHCDMEVAIDGFLATRDDGLDMREVADRLQLWGVFAPFNKAAYIDRLRNDGQDLPHPDYHTFRDSVKLPGLGWAKLSFAACLADPFGADIVCLDTHMLQLYGIEVKNHAKYFRSLKWYETIERKLLREARKLKLPPFLVQWASWDWKRGQSHPHSFLWQSGRTHTQPELFPRLDIAVA